MARKVYISSDMSHDEDLGDVADEDSVAALIWPWLLTSFDDWGRSDASPKRLKKKVFPGIELVTVAAIEQALSLFQKYRLIKLYESDGKPYMSIQPKVWFKWQTHIRKEKRENDGSALPAPPDEIYAQEREGARDVAEYVAEMPSREDYRSSADVREDARDSALERADLSNRADTDIEGSRDSAQTRANLANCIPSPSPSPSPSINTFSISSSIGDNPFSLFENHKFGKLDLITKDLIGEAIDAYTEEWVKRAIKEAVIQNKISWSYVTSILKRWKASGSTEPWTLEKPDDAPKGKPTHYKAEQTKGGKPILPMANPGKEDNPMTPEEMERMREKIKRITQQKDNPNL